MYAIVDIAGKQQKVEQGAKVKVPRLAVEEGATAEFDRVLLVRTDDGVKVGTPVVEGAKVKATVVEHGRDKKIVVFKKKRRKGYKVKRGHRQPHTILRIDEIIA